MRCRVWDRLEECARPGLVEADGGESVAALGALREQSRDDGDDDARADVAQADLHAGEAIGVADCGHGLAALRQGLQGRTDDVGGLISNARDLHPLGDLGDRQHGGRGEDAAHQGGEAQGQQACERQAVAGEEGEDVVLAVGGVDEHHGQRRWHGQRQRRGDDGDRARSPGAEHE